MRMPSTHNSASTNRILFRFGIRTALRQLTHIKNSEGVIKRAPLIVSWIGFALMSLLGNVSLLRSLTRAYSVEEKLNAMNLGPCTTEACQRLMSPSHVWPQMIQFFWLGLAFFLVTMMVVAVGVPLCRNNYSAEDPDLEWISTFPVRLRTWLAGRLIQKAMLNYYFWLFALPMLVVVALYRNHALYWTLPAAIFVGLVTNIMATSVGVALDMWIQCRLTLKRQRDVRVIASMLGFLIFAVTYFGFRYMEFGYWRTIFDYADVLQNNALIAFVGQLLALEFPGFGPYLTLLLLAVITAGCSILFMEKLLNKGLSVDSGLSPRSTNARRIAPTGKKYWESLPTMMRQELRIVARDRQYAFALLALPLLCLFYLLMPPAARDPSLPPPKFISELMLGAMLVMAYPALNRIHRTPSWVWLLTSSPRPLMDILREQQRFWVVLAGLIMLPGALVIHNLQLWLDPMFDLRYALALAVIGLYAKNVVDVSLVLSMMQTDQTRKHAGPAFMLLSLGPIMTINVSGGEPWTACGMTLLYAGMVLGFHDKARAFEPYVLDPASAPTIPAGLSDGMIAAMLYALLANITFLFVQLFSSMTSIALLWGNLIGGLIALVITQFYFETRQTTDVPRYLGRIRWQDLLLLPLLLTAVLAGGWLWQQQAPGWRFLDWLYFLYERKVAQPPPPLSLLLLAGFIGPLVDEFIFRGLIFRGARTRFGFWVACFGSALLATLCYKPADFGPVLLVGLASGILYHRTKILWPGVLLGIIFNLIRLTWY
ncbi:MAG TPA: CPBP family intramembrane glutamic endopeptidase [Oligoflexus sp.]|uniref:CPBP family intramembrane glutamic endopeptidase n=1 Tax=Oligoflexus sp. TaxID=1971216 RepID=UPI002D4CBE54|nr:CPBP family intramembrane glutamic endopeptidase [Oligoflexus sp.]HYX38669.1 CPBP family intramembrane glutamic endopeptidase [Oligoflexus sp.]